METVYEAVKINDYIHWVGAIDWTTRDFHGYSTNRGTTYNAYLIFADKITLIDTVKEPYKNEFLSRISSIIDPGEISYIISNHSEMDHSGCLPEIIDMVKPEKVFASKMGVKALNEHFHNLIDLIEVKDGDSISLGNMDVNFFETKMLHWPDSMFSYLPADKLLFSNDAFGMHLASNERYADEIEDYILKYEAEKYYANILLPYSPLIKKLLDKVASLGLEFDMIMPDHGPIWRTKEDIAKIIGFYGEWAEQQPAKKAVILFDTMWNSTEKMAHVISEGLVNNGIETQLMPMKTTHRSDAVKEVFDSGALIVGSPTLNNNIFPTMADVMTYMKGLRPQNLIGASFGSYGWSGESVDMLENMLMEMGVEIVGKSVKAHYVPNADELAQCFNLGKTIAEKLNKIV